MLQKTEGVLSLVTPIRTIGHLKQFLSSYSDDTPICVISGTEARALNHMCGPITEIHTTEVAMRDLVVMGDPGDLTKTGLVLAYEEYYE